MERRAERKCLKTIKTFLKNIEKIWTADRGLSLRVSAHGEIIHIEGNPGPICPPHTFLYQFWPMMGAVKNVNCSNTDNAIPYEKYGIYETASRCKSSKYFTVWVAVPYKIKVFVSLHVKQLYDLKLFKKCHYPTTVQTHLNRCRVI